MWGWGLELLEDSMENPEERDRATENEDYAAAERTVLLRWLLAANFPIFLFTEIVLPSCWGLWYSFLWRALSTVLGFKKKT